MPAPLKMLSVPLLRVILPGINCMDVAGGPFVTVELFNEGILRQFDDPITLLGQSGLHPVIDIDLENNRGKEIVLAQVELAQYILEANPAANFPEERTVGRHLLVFDPCHIMVVDPLEGHIPQSQTERRFFNFPL